MVTLDRCVGLARNRAWQVVFALAVVNATPAFAGDNDGIPYSQDNCPNIDNPKQFDTDRDGFGNACDADFNQDGWINAADQAIYDANWLSGHPLYDIDENGVVNSADAALVAAFVNDPTATPGPSGLGSNVDGDGWTGGRDNCQAVKNPAAIDSDNDGFGNRCDFDFDQDGVVTAIDTQLFIDALYAGPPYDPVYDCNNDGLVWLNDFACFGSPAEGDVPGPGATPNQDQDGFTDAADICPTKPFGSACLDKPRRIGDAQVRLDWTAPANQEVFVERKLAGSPDFAPVSPALAAGLQRFDDDLPAIPPDGEVELTYRVSVCAAPCDPATSVVLDSSPPRTIRLKDNYFKERFVNFSFGGLGNNGNGPQFVEARVKDGIEKLEAGQALGYNGMVVWSLGWGVPDITAEGPRYVTQKSLLEDPDQDGNSSDGKNLLLRAANLGMDLIPWDMETQWGADDYFSDQSGNLVDRSEGFPIEWAPFEVQAGGVRARIVADQRVVDPHFDTACPSQNCSWFLRALSEIDTSVYRENPEAAVNQSVKMTASDSIGTSRLEQYVTVVANRTYELTAHLKSENGPQGGKPSGTIKIFGLVDGALQTIFDTGLNKWCVPTTSTEPQVWTECRFRFNTRGNTTIRIAAYAAGSGFLWIDDLTIDEAGLPSGNPDPQKPPSEWILRDITVPGSIAIFDAGPILVVGPDPAGGDVVYLEGPDADFEIDYLTGELTIPSGSRIPETLDPGPGSPIPYPIFVKYYEKPKAAPNAFPDKVISACYDEFFTEKIGHRTAALIALFGSGRHIIGYDELPFGGWNPGPFPALPDTGCAPDGGTFDRDAYVREMIRRSHLVLNAAATAQGAGPLRIYMHDSLVLGWGETLASKHGWNGDTDATTALDVVPTTSVFQFHGRVGAFTAGVDKLQLVADRPGQEIMIHSYYGDPDEVSDWLIELDQREAAANPLSGVTGYTYGAYYRYGLSTEHDYDDLEDVRNRIEEAGRWAYDLSWFKGCGNGLLDAGEQCDGGDVRSGDGCSATCQLE